MYSTTLLLIAAYALGSIPTAVWTGKLFYDLDIREHGSGNAGATNTFRVLGKKAGIPVLIIDILKGYFALRLAFLSTEYQANTNEFITLQIALAVAAVVGHIFPLFAGFKGGKGVATLLGVVFALHFSAALAAAGIFLILLIVFHYVSVGSITAGISFPIMIIFVFKSPHLSLVIFSLLVALLLVVTHKKNIKRLIGGNENKTYLFGKPKNIE